MKDAIIISIVDENSSEFISTDGFTYKPANPSSVSLDSTKNNKDLAGKIINIKELEK